MSKLPYFRWFPSDFDQDENVRLMNVSEVGLYLRLLNHAWTNDGVPSDAESLMVIAGLSKIEFTRHWKKVSKCFYSDGDRLRNKRQEEERAYANGKSEKATNAIRKRYERNTSVSTSVSTNVVPRAYDSDSISDSVSENRKESVRENQNPLPRGYAMDEQYATFREVSAPIGWISSDFIEAWPQWCRLDGLQRQSAIQGIQTRVESGMDLQLIPRPRKYLEKHEWERELPKPLSANKVMTRQQRILKMIEEA